MLSVNKYIRLFVLTVFCLTSCIGEMNVAGPQQYPVLVNAQEGSVQSKVAVDGTSVSWETTDKMSITAVSADGTFSSSELTYFDSDPGNPRKASFSGFVTMPSGAPEVCYFTYPVGSAMQVDARTGKISVIYASQNGNHLPFMYAKTAYDLNGVDARMKHVGAVLEITIDDTLADKVTDIHFAGNNLETLSPIIIDTETGNFDKPLQPVHQLSVPVAKSGKTYLCVPPVDLKKGFTLICSGPEGKMFKSFSSDGTLSGGYDFSSKVGYIIPVTIDGTFENFSLTCSDPVAAHTYRDGLLTGTDVKFTMTKTGASNKLIQAWGAKVKYIGPDPENPGKMLNVVVRSADFDATTPVSGREVTMNVENGWTLLPVISGGHYVFSPYYVMYNQTDPENFLQSPELNVVDPQVKITIDGATSYDYYKAYLRSGNVNDLNTANGFANTEIRGVSVSSNIHPSVITSLVTTFKGSTVSPSSGSTLKYYYNNLPISAFGTHTMGVVLKCGYHTYSQTRDFEVTGLPIEAVFTTDPESWSFAWRRLSSLTLNETITFRGTCALRSPGFHIPTSEGIKVVTACDSRHNVTGSWFSAGSVTMYINTCSKNDSAILTSGKTLTIGSDYYQRAGAFDNVSGFDSIGYLYCPDTFTLNSSESALMYSVSLSGSSMGSNTLVSFRHKIEYAK